MTDWTAKPYIAPNTLHCVDAFELLAALPDASVDMCLSDVPYNITACDWEMELDLPRWWAEMKRVMKPRGAVVMTASQPFTSKLVMSNLDWFKYDWVWDKHTVTNFGAAKFQPLRSHESVLIFCNSTTNYYPIFRDNSKKMFGKKTKSGGDIWGNRFKTKVKDGVGYPKTILKFMRPNNLTGGGHHPTQKPVALFEYLIKTYTNEGDLVIDPFVGSGTTAVAAHITGRRFICGDQSPEYIEIARRRVFPEFGKPPKRAKEVKPLSDLPLFEGLI